MKRLMNEMEMPLSLVLYDMQKEGVAVRREELKSYGDALVARIEELEHAIHEQAGVDFNINSPKQLGEVLFETMQIPGGKKTKTGYSTAADVLEKLSADYPIVRDILEYRGLTKLKSTYADGWQLLSRRMEEFIRTSIRPLQPQGGSVPQNRICRTFPCGWNWEEESVRYLYRIGMHLHGCRLFPDRVKSPGAYVRR